MKKHYFSTSILAVAVLSFSNINAQKITTYIGSGLNVSGGSDGTQHTASSKPFSMAMDYQGNVVFTDYNSKVKELFQIDTSVRSIAGSATTGFSGDGGNGTGAMINLPGGIWSNYSGDTIIFCDAANNAIRRLTNSGSFYTINTIVNTTATAGFSGDGGPASTAKLSGPQGVWRDGARNIYIADQVNNRIRKVDASGNISTIAGGGSSLGDGGPATSAQLNLPTGIFVDTPGNIYVADYGNNRIRKIDVSGNISTVAGGGSSLGDGGPATSAQLNGPCGVFVFAGSIYIADKNNNRVRIVNPSGVISTLAGNGTAGYSGDGGNAASAELKAPISVYVTDLHTSTESFSGIYICDQGNFRIRKIELPNAVKPVQAELKSEVFPNPSTGIFTIKLPANSGNVNVTVDNAVGTTVYTGMITNGKLQVNLSAEPAGVYFVHLMSGNASGIQQISLQK